MFHTTIEKIRTLCHGTVIQSGTQEQSAFFLHLSIDSRKVIPGDVFVCLKGQRVDGHKYIHQSIQKGAKGLICQDSFILPSIPSDVFVILVKSTSQALLDIASEITKLYQSILVTGSAGKTTTKQMLGQLMPFSHTTFGNYNTPIGLPVALTDVPKEVK
jgi:UDP-N-acetylmuramoyl-tripeptide--D-alanyl-D-alanine ligase